MKKNSEIIESLEKKGNIILPISDIYTSNDPQIKKFGLPVELSENHVYLGSERPILDVPIYTKFDVIFSLKEPKNYSKIKSELKFVKVRPGQDINFLPMGYSGICLVEFSEKKPDILDVLAQFPVPYNRAENDFLFFTTQDVMDQIMDILEGEESV